MNMVKTSCHAAFWISPEGKILEVGTSHIAKIIQEPGIFGLKVKHIRQIYREYGEPMGHEGKAREKILLNLISQGWIRLRRYPNTCWKINIDELSDYTQKILIKWATEITTKGIAGHIETDLYFPVVIVKPDGKFEHKITIGELADN